MNEREQIIQLWFKMWLTQQDLGMDDIFAEDVIYTESWSPKYNNRHNGNIEEFDGMSLIVWTADNKIKSLKEFGCNLNNYNPYEDSDTPKFRDEKTSWF